MKNFIIYSLQTFQESFRSFAFKHFSLLNERPRRNRKGSQRVLVIASLVILISIPSIAQDKSAQILESFKNKMEQVENYSVEVLIKVEVDFIKIKDRKATVTYTKPNQFDFKAEGFTLLPKRGLEMDYMKIMEEGYTSIYIKEDTVNRKETSMIKVIPDNPETEIILAEMWMDTTHLLLQKMRTYSRNTGSYTIYFYYSNHPFDLPDKLVVEFEVKNSKIPASFSGDLDAVLTPKKEGSSKGRVIIQYSGYEFVE
jgi:hypothetical protein